MITHIRDGILTACIIVLSIYCVLAVEWCLVADRVHERHSLENIYLMNHPIITGEKW